MYRSQLQEIRLFVHLIITHFFRYFEMNKPRKSFFFWALRRLAVVELVVAARPQVHRHDRMRVRRQIPRQLDASSSAGNQNFVSEVTILSEYVGIIQNGFIHFQKLHQKYGLRANERTKIQNKSINRLDQKLSSKCEN